MIRDKYTSQCGDLVSVSNRPLGAYIDLLQKKMNKNNYKIKMLSRFLNYFLEKHMLRWMHTSGSLCSFCVSFLLSLFFLFFFCFQGEKVLDLNFSLRRRVIEPFDLKSFQGVFYKPNNSYSY